MFLVYLKSYLNCLLELSYKITLYSRVLNARISLFYPTQENVCLCFHWCSVSVLTQMRHICPYSSSALSKILKSSVELWIQNNLCYCSFTELFTVRGRRKNIHLVVLWLSSFKLSKTYHRKLFFESVLTYVFPSAVFWNSVHSAIFSWLFLGRSLIFWVFS